MSNRPNHALSGFRSVTRAVNHFTVIESVYGRFIVNRHCTFQAEHLIKTGLPHIESELRNILAIVETLPAKSVVVDAGANIGPLGGF